MDTPPPPPPPPQTYRKRHRLTHVRQFKAVYEARVRQGRGPLTVFMLPNDLPHPRLGLTVGRRVGNAVARNRVKRRLRDAFRQIRHDLPTLGGTSYDIVVHVREHHPAGLDRYRAVLLDAILAVHRRWVKRRGDGWGDV